MIPLPPSPQKTIKINRRIQPMGTVNHICGVLVLDCSCMGGGHVTNHPCTQVLWSYSLWLDTVVKSNSVLWTVCPLLWGCSEVPFYPGSIIHRYSLPQLEGCKGQNTGRHTYKHTVKPFSCQCFIIQW